jgi:DNA repair photolyase
MPKCGSQILFCELPIRFDTYAGCSHLCKYCFSYRKGDIKEIKVGESANELKKWIEGKRSPETSWCDWNIPLHWGGYVRPFPTH